MAFQGYANIIDPVVVISKNETYVKQFRINGMKTTFQFSKPPPETNEIDWLRQKW